MFQAVGGDGAGFGFVIHHQRGAVSEFVDAVYLANQRQGAQRNFPRDFARLKHRTGGFMLGQPGQVALTHLRPARGIGQKLALAERQRTGSILGCEIDHGQPRGQVRRGRRLQGCVKGIEQGVQPVAEVALAKLGVKLVRLLQPQLAQRKKPVRAAAQILVAAGRQAPHREQLTTWERARRGLQHKLPQRARVGRQSRVRQKQGLHKAAGHLPLPAINGAPEHIKMGHAQGILPGRALGQGQGLARRPAEQFALGR